MKFFFNNFLLCHCASVAKQTFALKFLILVITLSLFSCSNNNNSNAIAIIDSLAKKDSVKKVVAIQTKLSGSEDSLKQIDSVVGEIKNKISKNVLRKKAMKGGAMSQEGMIYELFENGNLVYSYSDNGMEFGSEELECFFQNGIPIFSIVNRIKFGTPVNLPSDLQDRKITATQKTYFSNGKVLQQKTETFTKEKGWQKIPFENKLLEIIKNIDAELNRNGEWVKK